MFEQMLVLLLFPAAMAFCGSHDFVNMTIPNKVTLGLVVGFLITALLVGLDASAIGWHLAAGASALLVTFALFAGGVFGGGDAKMVAATAVWLGFEPLLEYALLAAVMGGALTLLLLQLRCYPWPSMVLNYSFIARLTNEKEGVPYGVALGAAAMVLYPQTAIWKATFV